MKVEDESLKGKHSLGAVQVHSFSDENSVDLTEGISFPINTDILDSSSESNPDHSFMDVHPIQT